MEETPILKVEGLKTYFPVGGGLFGKKQVVKAVNDVSFEVMEHETFGLVGESGCGKSTLGRTLVKIYEPTEGKIEFMGKDITKLSGSEMQDFRRNVQMIFQDPYASLNPRMTVGEIIREPMEIHSIGTPKERDEKVASLLETVGLKPDHVRRYPHEFSGGQRQRISIARTLALDPKFIVCDVLALGRWMYPSRHRSSTCWSASSGNGASPICSSPMTWALSFQHISNRIGAMYLGSLVEIGSSDDLYHHPLHPYTQALLASIPIPDPKRMRERKKEEINGEIPSPLNIPSGCPFRTRCPYATERCAQEKPQLRQVGNSKVACHLYDK